MIPDPNPLPSWWRKTWTQCTPEEQQAVRDYIRQIHESQQVIPPVVDPAILAAATVPRRRP